MVMIKLANSDYRGEQFVTDGDKVYVAATASSHRRSSFGEFVHSQDQIVREGLIVTLASGLPPNSGVTDIIQTAKQKETRYTIEEQFNDFKAAEGLTLPSNYVIHFTQELQNGTTEVYEWDIAAEQFSNNVGLDPKNFQVK